MAEDVRQRRRRLVHDDDIVGQQARQRVHQMRGRDGRALRLGLRGRARSRHEVDAHALELGAAVGRGGTLGVRQPLGQLVGDEPERRSDRGREPQIDRIASSDLSRIVGELDHRNARAEGRAGPVKEPRENVGADDENDVGVVERLPHRRDARVKAAAFGLKDPPSAEQQTFWVAVQKYLANR